MSILFPRPSFRLLTEYRANLNNPNTSEEAKQHSKEVLDNEFNGGNVSSNSDEGKNRKRSAFALRRVHLTDLD